MKKNRSMTEGIIWKQILMFTLPLLLGNIFQQLYNAVDSYVVGNYVGPEALAAVGASNPLINLIIGLFMGISTGAGILISRYYGGQKYDEVESSIHTFMAFSLIVGVLLTVLGLVFSPHLLKWLKTPAEVLPDATTYLRVYFWGVLFLVIYNSGAGVLRAVGNSRNPLIYLAISSFINVSLDLLFVIVFNMGILGVAVATLIAQLVSAVLVVIHLIRSDDVYKVVLKNIRIDLEMLWDIIRMGVPTGIQQTVVSFSNVLVQSYINSFGASAMAGFSASDKYHAFLAMPTNSLSLTITTFTSQNLGAKKKDRVQVGIRTATIMAIVAVVLLGIPTFIFAEQLIAIFSNSPEVIGFGAKELRIRVPFYAFLAINAILSGALRGGGLTIVPMLIMIFCFTILRQLFLVITMKINRSMDMIFWSYSVTWFASMILTMIYYRKSKWIEKA
ncbi:MATE family efflux transporter [Erysipelothrix urinaevulpis]|uniref:MATE family efflux transporter n=1 Tax=Erysipelothrix urinaevulpis TaxID=2683717 RepID=UPI00135AAF0D|nr:MATE family efflux transporter [Erysipelothrix urinaevulpis]